MPSQFGFAEIPAALDAVRRGFDDAANGRMQEMGSYAEYADLGIEE